MSVAGKKRKRVVLLRTWAVPWCFISSHPAILLADISLVLKMNSLSPKKLRESFSFCLTLDINMLQVVATEPESTPHHTHTHPSGLKGVGAFRESAGSQTGETAYGLGREWEL